MIALPDSQTFLTDKNKPSSYSQENPRIYNLRYCPSCGGKFFGMPGGRDAFCWECGYKDPCCSDS